MTQPCLSECEAPSACKMKIQVNKLRMKIREIKLNQEFKDFFKKKRIKNSGAN